MRLFGRLCLWFSAITGVAIYLFFLPLASVERAKEEQLITLPAEVLKIVSLQFKELTADITFLNTLVFLGSGKEQKKSGKYLPEQYEWVFKMLKNGVTLDPYFVDNYYLMNSALIWNQYKLADVNSLIAKGADYRSWDVMLPFFAGFNYYYFLNDNDKSFHYLSEASKRSGGNPFYDLLASRVAYKANKIELAVSYLEYQIKKAEEEGRRADTVELGKRLAALQAVKQLETALQTYRKLFTGSPAELNELVSKGLLTAMPKDPFGGKFYIDKDGFVKTTSNLIKR